MNIQNDDLSITPIVALGGSAGGYEAIGEFLDHMSPNSGLTFVVIIHRSPKSMYDLSFYIQSHTEIPVRKIIDGFKPQPNTIYFLPSDKDAVLVDGAFKIIDPQISGPVGDINNFFSSLARSAHQHGIAIVFSGMLGDGSEGIKEIKKYNGTTIAQDPQSARYPSMPQSAINTGAVDYIFPPAQIAAFVMREFGRPFAFFQGFQPRADNLVSVFGNLGRLLRNLKLPILLLDSDFKIIGFSGTIIKIIPTRDTDIGRPVTDLQLNIDYKNLKSDMQEVLSTLKIKEIEITESNRSRYLARIAPCDCAPFKKPAGIISFIDLNNIVSYEDKLEESEYVAPFGIVMAHADTDLRYTWVFNPHPDFTANDVIGKTDIEISQNDGTSELMALKKRVLESGRSEEKIIIFSLSQGLNSYKISAVPIYNNRGQSAGVSTVGVQLTSQSS